MTSPTYLFQGNIWKNILDQIITNNRIFLLLDYDGTLVPIEKQPSLAILPLEMRSLMSRLAKKHNIILAIVTGRSLNDIRNLIRINKIIYAANHGFQISSSGKSWIHPDAKRAIPILLKIEVVLVKAFKDISGILIENKGLTLSVHYRNVKSENILHIKNILKKVIQPYERALELTAGKKVIEVRPRIQWDKGHAILRILKMFRATDKSIVIFIGDDKTDEDAFKLLPSRAFSIRVGKNKSSNAKYFVHITSEVRQILENIISLKHNKR